MSARTTLRIGERVLLADGIGIVTDYCPTGFEIMSANGTSRQIGWASFGELRAMTGPTAAVPVHADLEPWWSGLPQDARDDALAKLEIVHLIVHGYRDGHPALARPDEPLRPFGPVHGESLNTQADAAALMLREQARHNPTTSKNLAYGHITALPGSRDTVKRWVRQWKRDGVRGLVDHRKTRGSPAFDRVPQQFRDHASREVAKLNGDPSPVSVKEIDRRVRVALRRDGLDGLHIPQRATQSFLAELMARRGKSSRAQRSNRLREVSGHTEYPAIRPGQIVAIDATRCDNLVLDQYDGTARSVEILTAIDVASRVVLACRVVPMSANGVDLRYLIYDILRAFHMVVDGTTVTDWRWAGLPSALDLTYAHVSFPGPGRTRKTVKGSPLDGVHLIPSLWPDGFRVDRGSINIATDTQLLLAELGIDLLPNRGGKSNDNAHIERWWETLQACLQSIHGYKGRNSTQRGRLVAREPLVTWRQLQEHLRKWIALDYHQDWHTGIVLPEMEGARLSPLDAFDAMLAASGRIDVPQRHDLLYQLLPVVWLTPNHTGIEHRNLVYSAPVLDNYRSTYTGQFRPEDRAMPFFVDDNDLSQLWFDDPDTDQIHDIPWRGRDKTLAPMTSKVVERARARIRDRGGNNALTIRTAETNILEQLEELTDQRHEPDIARTLFAAEIRCTASQLEHAAAQAARPQGAGPRSVDGTSAATASDSVQPSSAVADQPVVDLDATAMWPDYIGLDDTP